MTDEEVAQARRLASTISHAASELLRLLDQNGAEVSYDEVDHARRRRPEWQRRGRVFYAIAKRGGSVSFVEFIQIVLAAGYADMRGANGFFRGDPQPVLLREGEKVGLTDRGRDAARFYEEYWLPREALPVATDD